MSRKIAALLALLASALMPAAASAQSWAAPSLTPPNGNVSVPLNISSTAQSKSGGLLLNTGGATNGLIVQYGNVGIGNTSPRALLDLAKQNNVGQVLLIGETATNNRVGFGLDSSTASMRIFTVNNSSQFISLGGVSNTDGATYTEYSRIGVGGGNSYFNTGGGSVGIGTAAPGYKLEVSGSVGASSFFYTSDRSLKKNIAPLEDSLSKIEKLQGVSFNWKSDGSKSVGLIAQDVEKVYPELVNTNKQTGLKSVEYANLVGPLIEAVKEQQKEIDTLKAEVAALQANK